MTETARTIARNGGFKIWTPQGTPKLLQEPWRHHQVAGMTASPADEFVLPLPALADRPDLFGVGVAIGSEIWVHNLGDEAVVVRNGDSSYSTSVAAHRSSSFVLVGTTTTYGTWRIVQANKSHGQGAVVPTGYRFDLDIRSNVSNLHVLQRAVDDGYDGTVAALVRVRVWPGVVVGSTSTLFPAVDFGGDAAISGVNWHASSRLFLRQDGFVSGKGGPGGRGGIGGTGLTGQPGQEGGKGLRAGFALTVTNTGTIQGGGGGGGGGHGDPATAGLHGGGGGGGAGASVDTGGFVSGGAGGIASGSAQAGSPGSIHQGGGFGIGSIVGTDHGGRGGLGGPPGVGGNQGLSLNDVGSGGVPGGGGAAVSQVGASTITWIAFGTINGNIVVE